MAASHLAAYAELARVRMIGDLQSPDGSFFSVRINEVLGHNPSLRRVRNMTTPDAAHDGPPETPEPVYDQMIRRPESGPDPLVPEPLVTPKKGK